MIGSMNDRLLIASSDKFKLMNLVIKIQSDCEKHQSPEGLLSEFSCTFLGWGVGVKFISCLSFSAAAFPLSCLSPTVFCSIATHTAAEP